jgi:hypothetical protein
MQPYSLGYQPLNYNLGNPSIMDLGTGMTLGRSPYLGDMGMPVNAANINTIAAPAQFGVDLNAPLTSGYSFNSINPNGYTLGANLSNLGSTAAPKSGLFSSFLQNKNSDGSTYGGYGMAALGVAQGLGNLYLGMKQYNLAKDTLAENKMQFRNNYEAQRTTTNAQLRDRQNARVASNAGAYQSVSDYMRDNEIKAL